MLRFVRTGLLLLFAFMGVVVSPNVKAQDRKPNVIVIYTDDQGSVDVNVYGANDLQTPHMDSLAAKGVRFTQFYAAAPVCSPSRASLLTGRYPQRAGVGGNISSQPGRDGMAPSQVTIAEMMKSAGYATAHIGKWHLGYSDATMPNAQGFDHSFGHMGGCIDNFSHFFYWNGPNRHDLWRNGEEVFHQGEFFGDLMLKEASAFITKNREKPFFMYYAINMPHYPYQGDVKWLKEYENVPYPRNLYAAFLSTIDDNIGRLLSHLDKLGIREDTIIIFQSDHGHSTEQRAHDGGGSAGPYRGAKFSLFEGGIRVPAIISWPGKLPQGAVRKQMATNIDWMPTIAELCGVDLPKTRIDGKSIVDVIRSDDAAAPHELFHWQSGRNQWAVRKGNWKLIANPNDTSNKARITAADRRFLVNLSDDVTEMTNFAEQHPEIVAELEQLHNEWVEEVKQQ